MVVVRFSKYRANKLDLEVKTKIKRIARRGDEVEIEFEGNPSGAELLEIARRLGLHKIETVAGEKMRKLLRSRLPEPRRTVIKRLQRRNKSS